jgi:hypothetical protein
MRIFLKYADTMDKIEGTFTFSITTAITGQTSYNSQQELYTSEGVLSERLRFSSGSLVYDEKIGTDGITTVTTWKTNGAFDLSVVDHGRVVSLSQFNANGGLLSKQLYFADGTKEIDNYNPLTGEMTNYTFYNLDGSRKVVTLGITGQAYVETATFFDKAGKQVLLERFDADGTKIFSRTWTADGAMYTHNYDPVTGKETSYSLTEADGRHVEATFGISGQAYSGQILHYDKNWIMTERERLDGTGHLLSTETFGTAASLKVYIYNASFGLTGYTLYAPDKSYVTVTYAAGSETKIAQQAIYDTHGTLVETLLYDANGVVFAHVAGGTTKVFTLNSAGLATGSITTASDGSYIVTKFVAGHEELPTSANKYTTTGFLYEIDTFNDKGQFIKADIRHTDGSKELHNYDPLTHVETGYIITHADKSREEANFAVTGKGYAQQIAEYNSAGVLVEMVRKYGDAEHTTSFHQIVNSDGSSEVHSYDTLGRQTSETLTATDRSRDAFNYSYEGTATSAATVQQTHYTTASVKQWVDITKADGSHLQTSYSDGAHLISHAGVRDVFAGLSTGNDTFEFDAGFGKDTIMGFQAGTGAVHDTIEFDIGVVADYAELLTMMTAQGADTLITISANDTIVIKSVNPTALSEDDFTFVDHSANWQV